MESENASGESWTGRCSSLLWLRLDRDAGFCGYRCISTQPNNPGTGRPTAVRAIFDLARAGNFPSVASNALAALVLSTAVPAAPFSWGLLAVAIVAGCLIYAGGSTFNDVFDAQFDAKHRPERAIPQGVISQNAAVVIGAIELLVGFQVFVVAGASAWMTAGLLATILAYDWLHKRWAGSVLLMAGCRLLLALVIATLPGRGFEPALLIWAGVVFAYIVILSILARLEYREGGPFDPAFAKSGGPKPRTPFGKSRGKRIARLLAFIPLLDAVALAAVEAWLPAVACIAAIPIGMWAQKRAAAT